MRQTESRWLCSAAARASALRPAAVSFVSTPSPEGRLTVLRRCYSERLMNSVACRGDTWNVNRHLKTKVIATGRKL